MVSVVIPYYQRARGILRRTLESVLAQDYSGKLCVLITDDGSPVPAEEELVGLRARDSTEIRIIVQENAGASAARNAGLDNIPEGTTYVAFLDSDDTWSIDHVSRAIAALAEGADVYTANWIPLGSKQDAFTQYDKVLIEDHEPLAHSPGAYVFKGNFLIQELIKPIGRISNLVLRWSVAKHIRFETKFRRSCEDIFYRLELAPLKPVVVFSTQVESKSGTGVNQYGSRKWGTPEMFDILRDRLLLCKITLKRFVLSAEELAVIESELRCARYAVVLNALSVMRSDRRIAGTTLRGLWDADALLPLAIPGALFSWATGGSRRL